MRLTDFAPLNRSSIGFDRLFDLIENAAQYGAADTYPAYNIERTDENSFRITVAVAGFSRDELEITFQPNQLIVSGRKAQTVDGDYLFKGIESRSFQRHFSLAEYVRVTGATLHNGMLSIDLAREMPEAAKPRRIDIASRAKSDIEGSAAAR